jgi:hypothetical protein
MSSPLSVFSTSASAALTLLLGGVHSPPSAVFPILSRRRQPWPLAYAWITHHWIQNRGRRPRRSPRWPSTPRGSGSAAWLSSRQCCRRW